VLRRCGRSFATARIFGGHSLTDATLAALDASAAVVVLCSLVAAGRVAVNEEVRLFSHAPPDRRHPVMIDGKCPTIFRRRCASRSRRRSVSDRPVTILGPDLARVADGKSLGLAKVIAGLTAFPRRCLSSRRGARGAGENRMRGALSAVILALAIAGGGTMAIA